jgi:hypothetical protein
MNSPLKDPFSNEIEENKDKTREIEALRFVVERLQDLLQNCITTRNKDGSFADSICTCVIELTGLEVANENICAVAKHLFMKDFSKGKLPSSKTVQSMVDDGYYVAKAFISEKLAGTSRWRLNRDGTTRNKQKILDTCTTITLSSGEVMSLGFTRVSHETAAAVNNTTKEHFSELASIQNDVNTVQQNFIRSSLEKLGYCMSDRAANEKANQLLASWID